MANKKINELDSRASLSLSDLMAVGDPSTGYLYKTTISDLKTLTGAGVISFNGRFGAVSPAEGDYTLNQLGDVIVTSASNGQVLQYNGSNWVNAALPAETDTLDSVTDRGNTTTNDITVGSVTAAGLSNLVGQIKTFATTGNVYIGDSPVTATDAGYKVDISGKLRVKSSVERMAKFEHTNGTFFDIVVGNGVDATLGNIEIQRNGEYVVQFGASFVGFKYPTIKSYNGSYMTLIGGVGGGSSVGNSVRIMGSAFDIGAMTPTSGELNTLIIGGGANEVWQVSSGNATYNLLQMTPIFNTTGSYSGTARGLYINPTFTSQTGLTFYAIDAVAGKVKLGDLAGSGSRMVVTDASGLLSTQAIPTGTITSIALTAPTGFTVSGSPLTSSGTLGLSFAAGYSLPTTVKQSNWDDAYTFVAAFPTQTGNSGKYLTTNGSALSWATVTAGISSISGTSPVVVTTTSGAATVSMLQAGSENAGYLSSTDWNTFNSKQNALTNPVTGTGTTNTLPKFTAGSTIGNSTITDDGVVITLGASVTVSQSLRINGTQLNMYGATAEIIARTADNLDLYTDGNTRALRLAKTTGAATFLSSIAANSAAFTTSVAANSATFNSAIYIGTNPASSGAGLALGISNDNAIRWRNAANSGNLGFYLSGANIFTFDAGIYVAGASTIAGSLTVTGNSSFFQGGANTQVFIKEGTFSGMYSPSFNSISDNIIRFRNYDSTEYARFNSSGQLLINTQSGVSGGGALQVNGDVNINGNFRINGTIIGGGGGSGVTGAGTTNYLTKWTGSTTLGNSVIFESGNNIGIGTTTTSGRVTIAPPTNSTTSSIEFTNSDNAAITSHFSMTFAVDNTNTVGGRVIQFGKGGKGYGNLSSITMLMDTDTGNVMIGTTTNLGAGYKLQVNGSISMAYASFFNFRGSSGAGDVLVDNSGSALRITGNTTVSGSVTASAFFESSDIRFKNILAYNPEVNVSGIDVIKFTRHTDSQIRYGYSAQQVQSIFPDAVIGKDELVVNYIDIHTLKIAALEKEVAELKAKLN